MASALSMLIIGNRSLPCTHHDAVSRNRGSIFLASKIKILFICARIIIDAVAPFALLSASSWSYAAERVEATACRRASIYLFSCLDVAIFSIDAH